MSIDWAALAATQETIVKRLQEELADRNIADVELTLANALAVQVTTLNALDSTANDLTRE